MKKLLLSILTLTSLGATAQVVNIPDANFKAALVANLAINENGDTEIQVSEANNYQGALNVSQQNIADMTGLEEFTQIFNLNCGQNPLTAVDVSSNTALTSLTVNFTNITSLDVSNLANLTLINCTDNSALVALDLSNNTSLTNIRTTNNALTSLNVRNGNNSNVTLFKAQNNPSLTCIEVDDAVYSTTNWTDIDAAASFSENCSSSVGINEATTGALSIYPNPALNTLTIANTVTGITNIKIVDVTGKMVKTVAANATTIDVADLTSGVYFLQVQTAEKLANMKFVKQ